MRSCVFALLVGLSLAPLAHYAFAEEPSFRLPSVDLHQRIIWGAECTGPDGIGLRFGGQDQESDVGQPPTEILLDGEWTAISSELKAGNRLQALRQRTATLAQQQKNMLAAARHAYLEGLTANELSAALKALAASQAGINRELAALADPSQKASPKYSPDEEQQLDRARELLHSVEPTASAIAQALTAKLSPELLAQMHQVQLAVERATDLLGAEPPGRALSPIVFDPKTRSFILFGGDHLDYLTNDLWVFDWAERKWTQRFPETAPPPRANHQLSINADGRVALSGGYKYTSNTDYMGGQYTHRNDGEWIYDPATNRWSGGKLVAANAREYRTGPFDPQFFLTGDKPDAAATAERLKSLSPNTWIRMQPPQLPQMNRDWGTAVIDPDHDLILRFSGGHCAHSGSDVLHYHMATNRWELPFPVEFPLGQTYTNTEYPAGYNLNQRPWVTGHTYQSYAYEPAIKRMLFAGQMQNTFLYDPAIGDWTGRFAKPKGMAYDSCFFTTTLCLTPDGVVAWTNRTDEPNVFRFDSKKNEWAELPQTGKRVPGSSVDNSTVVYDTRRRRLIFARKDYGDDHHFDGHLHTLDPATGTVEELIPQNAAAAAKISYLCQLRYDPDHDLLLVGATLPPDATGLRPTPAYDCATNRWISLAISGDDPNGPEGRNVSLGLMYDTKRHQFWAVDTRSEVFVLKLDPKNADPRPLE